MMPAPQSPEPNNTTPGTTMPAWVTSCPTWTPATEGEWVAWARGYYTGFDTGRRCGIEEAAA